MKEDNQNIVVMRPKELMEFLQIVIPAKEPVLIAGPPGVGKTSIISQAGHAIGYDNQIFMHPIYGDQTLTAGMPVPNLAENNIQWLPYGHMDEVLRATVPTILGVDDLGSGSNMQQASFFQVILERKTASGHHLPDCVSVISATNRREDKSGVSGMLEALKSRFTTIVHLVADLDATWEYGLSAGWHPYVLAFLKAREELLYDFTPTPDMTNSPNPRTWAAISRLVYLNLPDHLEYAAYAGAIGKGAANEFLTHKRRLKELPPMEDIIRSPETAPIPTDPSMIYAICSGLCLKADKKSYGPIIRYAQRLDAAGRADMAFMLMHDIAQTKRELCNTPEYIQLQLSDFGKRLREL